MSIVVQRIAVAAPHSWAGKLVGVIAVVSTLLTTSRAAAQLPSTAVSKARVVLNSGRTLRVVEDAALLRLLSLDTITVRDGDILKSLLLERGVRPDGNALAYTYTLNPAIRHADSLQVGQMLVLPRADAGLLMAESRNARLAVLVAADEKASVRATATQAQKRLEELSAVLTAQQRAMLVGERVQQQLAELSQLPESHPSFTPEVVAQLGSHATAIAEAMESLAAGVREGESLARIQEALSEVEREGGELQKCYQRGASCALTIVVHPRSDGSSEAVPNLRLYYAAKLWLNSPRCANRMTAACATAFRLSSPKHQTELTLGGKFRVWAVRDGQPVSCDLPIEPTPDGGREFDLTIPVRFDQSTCR